MHPHLKKLIHILSDGEFHSGAAIGDELGVTRSAIWKLVKQVRALGFSVEAISGRGYCITGGIDLLHSKDIKKYISPKHRNRIDAIEVFEQIGSTNDYLLEKAKSSSGEIRVCLAEQQSGGKGRLGRKWVSPFGANIYLSFLFPFSKDASELAGLSLVVGTLIADTLSELGIKKDIGLKWPNDIWWKGRKLGGILIETSGEAHGVNHAVIGIGLNVRMPEREGKRISQPWVDIREINEAVADRNKIVGLLIDALIKGLLLFEEKGFSAFYDRFCELDVLVNQPVSLETPLGTVKGIACGIDKQGRFILEDQAEKRRVFSAGDISIQKVK